MARTSFRTVSRTFSWLLLAVGGALPAQSQCSSGPAAPSGPTTGGPAVPTDPHAAITGFPDDRLLTSWRYWWELNKDAYLGLPRQPNAQNAAPVHGEVRAALIDALRRSEQRDLTAAAMVAMAKVGGIDADDLGLLRHNLRHDDKQIREAAVLALGISAHPAAVEDLVELLRDSPDGRRLVGRNRVEDRMRYFAAYGLGMLAHHNDEVGLRTRAFAPLQEVLAQPKSGSRDIRMAVVNALRMFRPGSEPRGRAKRLHWLCVDTLWQYYERDLGKSERSVQAHVPPAIASLLGRGGGAERARIKQRFAEQIEHRRGGTAIEQSTVLALGELALPREESEQDARYSELLLEHHHRGRDPNARNFSLIALAKIGGEHNRAALLKLLPRCKTLQKPWAALALGVLTFDSDRGAEVDATVGRALHKELRAEKNPECRTALCVALGLTRYHGDKKDAAARDVAKLLERAAADEVLAGYACIGVGLMGYGAAREDVETVLTGAAKRPGLFRQAATALALLDDPEVVAKTSSALGAGDRNVQDRRLFAQTAGVLRSRDAAQVLLQTLRSKERSALTRALAAAALGAVFERERLPWSAKIAANMNYAAVVATLTEPAPGLLPIL